MTAHHFLTLDQQRARPALPFLEGVSLSLGRVHEFCGNARHTLAMLVARASRGPVFWIAPGWGTHRLNADGMVRFAEPGRFTFVTPTQANELLWAMEEVLRSGIVPLVVADIPSPPALTPVRRLHLAAEAGAERMRAPPPLGLLLTPGEGGAPGVESRWHMAAAHGPETPEWTLTRSRARTDRPKTWRLTWKAGKPELKDMQNTDV